MLLLYYSRFYVMTWVLSVCDSVCVCVCVCAVLIALVSFGWSILMWRSILLSFAAVVRLIIWCLVKLISNMAPSPIEEQMVVPPGPGPQGGGSISLSTLIEYATQRTYHELTVLSELWVTVWTLTETHLLYVCVCLCLCLCVCFNYYSFFSFFFIPSYISGVHHFVVTIFACVTIF